MASQLASFRSDELLPPAATISGEPGNARRLRQMLLTVLGRSPETRERWITSHAATPDEAEELRALLRIAATDEALGATDPLIGAACGPWTLTQRLGDGGQGVVYEAQSDGSVAAVKVLREGGDAETARKLDRETTALAAIDHPG
ncbi:MAG: hypothetical protein QF471_03940, partial [Phycisphaerales bacterium]|nr:hypothetical protein [Phycisphaerales bacterium]